MPLIKKPKPKSLTQAQQHQQKKPTSTPKILNPHKAASLLKTTNTKPLLIFPHLLPLELLTLFLRTTKTPKKRKDAAIQTPPTPTKKALLPLHDHLTSDDMDTSYPAETQDISPNTDPSHTPNHFFGAARKGKKVGFTAPSSTKSGDIDLSPKPSSRLFLETAGAFPDLLQFVL
jgi:hypothetical protein